MLNELKLIENIDILFKSKVILFGAGMCGSYIYSVLESAGIPIFYFCDNDPRKRNNYKEDIQIISPVDLKNLDSNEKMVVIITVYNNSYSDQIIEMLDNLKLETTDIFTYMALQISLTQNISRINNDYKKMNLFNEKIDNMLISNHLEIHRIYPVNDFIRLNGILIYQSGKVGSLSIRDSLNSLGIQNIHFHTLNHKDNELILNEAVKAKLKILSNAPLVKVITLVREPIIKDLSRVFQNLGMFGIHYLMSAGDSFMTSCINKIKQVATGQDVHLAYDNCKYGHQFDWFDYELKTVFNIDVFNYSFDKEKGFSVIKQNNIEVLVIKLEKLNTLESVIGDFVGSSEFSLVNANEASEKSIKHLYKNVREVIKIPREIVDLYYKDNPRMDHFYSEEEKATFLEQWKNNLFIQSHDGS